MYCSAHSCQSSHEQNCRSRSADTWAYPRKSYITGSIVTWRFWIAFREDPGRSRVRSAPHPLAVTPCSRPRAPHPSPFPQDLMAAHFGSPRGMLHMYTGLEQPNSTVAGSALRSGIRLEASFSGIPRFPSADVNFFPHDGAADAQRATHHAGHSPHSLICLILILRLQYLRGLYIMDIHSQ